MKLKDLLTREEKANVEIAALQPKLKSYAAEAETRRATARREWVARMLATGRIRTQHVQPLLDVLQAVEEYQGGDGLVVRQYQYGKHTARPSADLVRGIIGGLPEGVMHGVMTQVRQYADPAREADERAKKLQQLLAITYEQAVGITLKEDEDLARQYTAATS